MSLATSDRYKAAIQSSHTAVSRVEVRDVNGTFIDQVPMVPGTWVVDVDETRQTTRTLRGQVVTRGVDDGWTPADATDLLHPLSGNELWVFRGIDYGDGTQEVFSAGIFGIGTPTTVDDMATVNTSVQAYDRMDALAARSWPGPFVITEGTPVIDAIRDALAVVWPTVRFRFAPTPFVVPATVFGLDPTQSNPAADLISLATAAGMRLRFDVAGTLELAAISDPATTPVTAAFVEGPGLQMNKAGRSFDASTAKNGVIVRGNGPGGAPVKVERWNTDPNSPSYYLGPWGKRGYPITTPLIPAVGQSTDDAIAAAQRIADAQYPLRTRAEDDPTWTGRVDASIEEGDVVQLGRARIGLDGPCAIRAFTMPLDPDVLTDYIGRPRVAP